MVSSDALPTSKKAHRAAVTVSPNQELFGRHPPEGSARVSNLNRLVLPWQAWPALIDIPAPCATEDCPRNFQASLPASSSGNSLMKGILVKRILFPDSEQDASNPRHASLGGVADPNTLPPGRPMCLARHRLPEGPFRSNRRVPPRRLGRFCSTTAAPEISY